MKKSIHLLFLSLLLVSCSSLQDEYCKQDKASAFGEEDAKSWGAFDPQKFGHHCQKSEEFNSQQYETAYQTSYRHILSKQCSEESVSNQAKDDAIQHLLDFSHKQRLDMCSQIQIDSKKLKQVYDRQFSQSFCTAENIQSFGEKKGLALFKNDSSSISNCDKKLQRQLKVDLMKGYSIGLINACSAINLRSLAKEDARKGLKIDSSLMKLDLCPQELKSNAIALYSVTFAEENSLIQQEQFEKRLAEEKRKAQKLASRVDFTFEQNTYYSLCELGKETAKAEVFTISTTNNHIKKDMKAEFSFYDEEGLLISKSSMDAFLRRFLAEDLVFHEYNIPNTASSCRFAPSI